MGIAAEGHRRARRQRLRSTGLGERELACSDHRNSGKLRVGEHIRLVERRWHWYYLPIAQPRGEGAWTEHAELIKAIAAADADLAAGMMQRHTEHTQKVYRDKGQAKSKTK
jgi:DNA-binding GntR family transcriptional regulator